MKTENSKIRLVALDMDGTLLDSKKRKPEDFIPWVLSHPRIRTVIASGRQYAALLRDFDEIRDHLTFIAENGGLVFAQDEMIYCDEMAFDDIRNCLRLAEQRPEVVPVLCGAKSAYVREVPADVLKEIDIYYEKRAIVDDLEACAKQDRIVKIALYFKEHDAETKFALFADEGERARAVLSGTDWIDVANRETSKGMALKAIQQSYGIRKEECMAFGDYLNDMTLLLNSGESYCMANGHPDLKAAAKYIAASNDEDGVMKILRTFENDRK